MRDCNACKTIVKRSCRKRSLSRAEEPWRLEVKIRLRKELDLGPHIKKKRDKDRRSAKKSTASSPSTQNTSTPKGESSMLFAGQMRP